MGGEKRGKSDPLVRFLVKECALGDSDHIASREILPDGMLTQGDLPPMLPWKSRTLWLCWLYGTSVVKTRLLMPIDPASLQDELSYFTMCSMK